MNEKEKNELEKNDLINDVDRLFYDVENIEDQASVFRSILNTLDLTKLAVIKVYIKNKEYKGGQ
jgi:hypothetical protein|tara:strand:+ start:47 stop:238 length:192 start_codon:yes stop_codon:yes gene_type:complete